MSKHRSANPIEPRDPREFDPTGLLKEEIQYNDLRSMRIWTTLVAVIIVVFTTILAISAINGGSIFPIFAIADSILIIIFVVLMILYAVRIEADRQEVYRENIRLLKTVNRRIELNTENSKILTAGIVVEDKPQKSRKR